MPNQTDANNTQWMVAFLNEAAKYFSNRPTNGEDAAHWSNVVNSENCRKIAQYIQSN